MKNIGFCTGALAKDDFRLAINKMVEHSITAIELSAMYLPQLREIHKYMIDLNQSHKLHFKHTSIHVPKFGPHEEDEVLDLLNLFNYLKWPMIVHPQFIYTPDKWEHFDQLLCVENMDKRAFGKTTREMSWVFQESSPKNASMCFDIGHTRHVDPTMKDGEDMLKIFKRRINQVHISEVRSDCKHISISPECIKDFKKITNLIPSDVVVIIESMIPLYDIESELKNAKKSFQDGWVIS